MNYDREERHKGSMSLPLIYTAALVAGLLFAFWKGGREAQMLGVGYLAAQIAAMAVSLARWDAPQLRLMLIDLLLFGWIAWIVIRTSLTWPIAAGVLQTLTMLGHLARLAVPTMEKMGYFVLLQWTAWPAFLTIVIGTALDWHAGRTSQVSWPVAGWLDQRRRQRD